MCRVRFELAGVGVCSRVNICPMLISVNKKNREDSAVVQMETKPPCVADDGSLTHMTALAAAQGWVARRGNVGSGRGG
jgi:hypothetical protein